MYTEIDIINNRYVLLMLKNNSFIFLFMLQVKIKIRFDKSKYDATFSIVNEETRENGVPEILYTVFPLISYPSAYLISELKERGSYFKVRRVITVKL